MNLLFLSLINISDINVHGIYNDLLRVFQRKGHNIYIVSPSERKHKQPTNLKVIDGVHYLNVWTFNYQKTNFIEKGISTLLIEYQYKLGIKKYYSDIKFNLILYPTPPITFANVVKYVKRRDNAFSYLLLKDIFPQNAVDLGIMSENGLMYKYFRHKEEELYEISDAIGCMSCANVDYLLRHNNEIPSKKVGVCPNSIEILARNSDNSENKNSIRESYGLPFDREIYIYGGNLGKPQDIPFIIKCLNKESDNENVYFVIVGSGTEYCHLEEYLNSTKQKNVKLFPHMPQDDFDKLVSCCDAGLIFLNHRFTIPNYPSRLLSYLSAGLPILAATDKNTDIRDFLEENEIGVWCESSDIGLFHNALIRLSEMNIPKERVITALRKNFDVETSYEIIISKLDEINCK